MKVMLVFPNLSEVSVDKRMLDQWKFQIRGIYPPLGLAYIAGALEQAGHTVNFVDGEAESISMTALGNRIRAFSPDIMGLYCGTLMINKVREVAQLTKNINPDIVTVVGGPHLSVYPEITIRFPEFDIGVIGEGEITMCEVASTLQSKADLSNIKGIIFKKKQDIIRTSPRDYISDLDTIPFPSWHLLPIKKYNDILTKTNKFATMITSRGCPFNCIFCSPECRLGRKFRYRSPENVIEEILLLKNDFWIEEICFYDDTFTVNKKRVMKLCDEIINRKIDIKWECRTRVDLVNDELLKKMASAGCYRIRYGIESGDNQILRNLNKGITVAQIKDAVTKTKKYNIEVFGYFMLGCPGETIETINKTLDLSRQLKLDYVNFNIMSIRPPGSELVSWAVKNGYIESDYWERFTEGKNLNPAPPLITDTLSSSDLKYFQLKAYIGFYSKPMYLLKSISNRDNIRMITKIIYSTLILLKNNVIRKGFL